MPLYEITHSCYLTEAQKDEFATALTTIHAEKFNAPRMFVQIRYTHTPAPEPGDKTVSEEKTAYIGGRRFTGGNYIRGHIRSGPSRTQADFNNLILEIVEAWNRVIPMPRAKGGKIIDYSLWSCHIQPSIAAGWEAGYLMPVAGADTEWLREHWEEFEMKGQGDDVRFRDLVEDVKSRDLLGGAENTHKRKLEELLGWGDSA